MGLVLAAAAASCNTLNDRLTALAERQRQLKRDRGELQRQQKNEDRRKTRLLARAQGLSDDELVQRLATRAAAAAAKAKANAKAKAKGKAKAKAKAKGDSCGAHVGG